MRNCFSFSFSDVGRFYKMANVYYNFEMVILSSFDCDFRDAIYVPDDFVIDSMCLDSSSFIFSILSSFVFIDRV
jgi:hypothetical protein